EQDLIQAHMWLTLAAAQEEKGAEEARKTLAKSMTWGQVGQAKKLATKWTPKKNPQSPNP
ncbi:MAG: hypothetical protein ACE5NA_08835, partial [Nitrospiraceae bacterium]